MFSKTHNLHIFNMMTNMNRIKPNGDQKTRYKESQKEQDQPKKKEENRKYHESNPKVPLNLPDVLQNPQFTLFHHDDQQEPN